jgi:hypothetical protein
MMRATTEKEEAARDEEEERRAEAARQLSLELEKERSQVEASSRMARLQEVGGEGGRARGREGEMREGRDW